jgi:hypothetical protein
MHNQHFILVHAKLTPKEEGHFSQKNTSNLPFLAQEAQTKKIIYFFKFNCKILL